MHSNEVSFIVSLQIPLFKHGPLEHGLESLWQANPVLNWLHWQTYCCIELNTHKPWLEQLAKHDDKSPVYFCNMLFNWLPVLFGLSNEEALTKNEDDVKAIETNVVVVVVVSNVKLVVVILDENSVVIAGREVSVDFKLDLMLLDEVSTGVEVIVEITVELSLDVEVEVNDEVNDEVDEEVNDEVNVEVND